VAAKPIVDGIEAEYSGRLRVLRLDVQDPAGKELGGEYGVLGTPTFIFLDSQGTEQWRSVGSISSEQVVESLR
jgi:thiol:disulfide interchange protein